MFGFWQDFKGFVKLRHDFCSTSLEFLSEFEESFDDKGFILCKNLATIKENTNLFDRISRSQSGCNEFKEIFVFSLIQDEIRRIF